jgi:hypothetical protein
LLYGAALSAQKLGKWTNGEMPAGEAGWDEDPEKESTREGGIERREPRSLKQDLLNPTQFRVRSLCVGTGSKIAVACEVNRNFLARSTT